MVVGMCTPGPAPFTAHLRNAHRTLHGPEMRVSQRNIHGLQHDGMPHLPPVCINHVGCCRQTCRPAEFAHDFTPGVAIFCTTRIFRIGQDIRTALAQADCLGKRPGTIRIQCDTCIRECFFECFNGFDLIFTLQYAAFELEIPEAVMLIRSLCKLYDAFRRECFFRAQTIPFIGLMFTGKIRQICLFAVTDKEKIAQELHFVTLTACTQKLTGRQTKIFAQKIKAGRFNSRYGMDHRTQIEGLQAAALCIAVLECFTHIIEDMVVRTNRTSNYDCLRILKCLTDFLAARYFTYTGIAGFIGEDDDIPRKKSSMCSTEIQQHAIVTRYGDNLHFCDFW